MSETNDGIVRTEARGRTLLIEVDRRTKLKPFSVTAVVALPSVTMMGLIDSIAGCGDSAGFGSG